MLNNLKSFGFFFKQSSSYPSLAVDIESFKYTRHSISTYFLDSFKVYLGAHLEEKGSFKCGGLQYQSLFACMFSSLSLKHLSAWPSATSPEESHHPSPQLWNATFEEIFNIIIEILCWDSAAARLCGGNNNAMKGTKYRCMARVISLPRLIPITMGCRKLRVLFFPNSPLPLVCAVTLLSLWLQILKVILVSLLGRDVGKPWRICLTQHC